jgi:hypothetical protein
MSDYPDFEGDKSGLYLKPEWSAKEATDKTFLAAEGSGLFTFGSQAVVYYDVPADKTLYITQISVFSGAWDAANADKAQHVQGLIGDNGVWGWYAGGDGGCSQAFSNPIVIKGGHEASFVAINYANHACAVALSAKGYEI